MTNRQTPDWLRYCLVFTAGLSIHLSFAPYNLWLATFTSICLYCALYSIAETVKKQGILSFVFGTGLFGGGVNWLFVSIHTYGEVPWLLAVIFTTGFVVFLAALFALPWLLVPKLTSSATTRLIVFPAFWFFGEWIRGWLLTGFPWLYLGYGQIESPFGGFIPLIGVLGAGFILTSLAALLVFALTERSRTSALISLTVTSFVLSAGIGLAKVDWTSSSQQSIPITLVQPDIPLRDKWDPSKAQTAINTLENLSNNSWHQGLLIWPEAALPFAGDSATSYVNYLDQLATSSDTTMITGLLTYENELGKYLNTVITLGESDDAYNKQRLVPFGEYVPLEDWLRGTMKFFNLPMSIISRGQPDQTPLHFNYDGHEYALGPAICYEIAYASLVRKMGRESNLLLTLSNDAWFGTSIGPWQHMQIAQARALENQKPLARATNNGVTAIVDYRGRIQDQIPQFMQGNLKSEIQPRIGMTPYTRFGELPIHVIGLILLAISALIINKEKTKLSTTD